LVEAAESQTEDRPDWGETAALNPTAVAVTGDVVTAGAGPAGAGPAGAVMEVAAEDGLTVVAMADGRADEVTARASSTIAIDWNTRDARGSGCSSRVRLKM